MARLLSLDVMRGFTVAGMILVNNGYGASFSPLKHAEWNGLSLSDLVFPFFLFIMGVSMYLSFSGKGFDLTASKFAKILKRAGLLMLIGIAINWFDMAIWGSPGAFGELRFWAVLQRIAVCYFVASLIVLTVNHRYVLPISISLLLVYAMILIFGNGYVPDRAVNVLYKVDEWMIGDAHIYRWGVIDPEGLVSTISSLANVLFGFYCGMKIKGVKMIGDKINALFVTGSLLMFAGWLVNFGMPYNKNIWSPSFALITSGFCALLLALVMIAVDQKGKRGRLMTFFQAFGVNALMMYVCSELMALIFGRIGLCELLYKGCSFLIPVEECASLAYAICFVLLNYAIAYPLFKKRIYIKL